MQQEQREGWVLEVLTRSAKACCSLCSADMPCNRRRGGGENSYQTCSQMDVFGSYLTKPRLLFRGRFGVFPIGI